LTKQIKCSTWAAYCASKSAVDLFLQTVHLEEEELGRRNFRCFSVSPGVVDTDMQAQIRKTKVDLFSTRNTFKGYYDKLELENPRSIAKKLILFLQKAEENHVLVSLKDFR
jgi:benzil reductase ((S)-benzoin forming)